MGTPSEGQQIEDITLETVMFESEEALGKHRVVRILDVDVRSVGGHRLRKKLEKVFSHASL
jgi:hypothetical protein